MPNIDYSQKIPNNVNLSSDRVLQRASSSGSRTSSAGGAIWDR